MKSYEDRKGLTKWKQEIHSKSAFLENGRLTLAKSEYNSDFDLANLIILNDYNNDAEVNELNLQQLNHRNSAMNCKVRNEVQNRIDLKRVHYLTLAKTPKKFEIFQLKKVKEQIELHLLYDYYEIGAPKRDNFKICNLEINQPIAIKINGKLDHSLSSGRERSYKEHSYIFHLLGYANTFSWVREPFEGDVKSIPEPIKTVDLMKELY
ncbi:hypothetical protein [Aquimarina brevivitae]|uniref:Uncharacterized protein n=1 Tax=Aquimarina brevivitae TaxID=323412 RepID=A0A4V2F7K6_9FLAO|nr:hypothetical protein [Aquimarina brevivitae]RZT00150.1 hypothetical protein EV197_1383 [Aquimarina brevivitae]